MSFWVRAWLAVPVRLAVELAAFGLPVVGLPVLDLLGLDLPLADLDASGLPGLFQPELVQPDFEQQGSQRASCQPVSGLPVSRAAHRPWAFQVEGFRAGVQWCAHRPAVSVRLSAHRQEAQAAEIHSFSASPVFLAVQLEARPFSAAPFSVAKEPFAALSLAPSAFHVFSAVATQRKELPLLPEALAWSVEQALLPGRLAGLRCERVALQGVSLLSAVLRPQVGAPHPACLLPAAPSFSASAALPAAARPGSSARSRDRQVLCQPT